MDSDEMLRAGKLMFGNAIQMRSFFQKQEKPIVFLGIVSYDINNPAIRQGEKAFLTGERNVTARIAKNI
jgi:hypothetical protein